jgi:hypothetical protein
MSSFKAVNFQRYRVLRGEWLTIAAGFVMVVECAVLRVDGVLSCDGLLRVSKHV